MPIEIKLENVPAGYVAEVSKKEDTRAKVITTEFVSSEDGDLLVSRLEGIPSDLLRKIPSFPPVREGTVDHLLAVIRRDKSATLYINELTFHALMRTKRPFTNGEAVFYNEIADIQKLELHFQGKRIDMSANAGIVFLFSSGWRKGLFYDFKPLLPKDGEPRDRDYDLPLLFGQYYAYLTFQERFKISEKAWASLMQQQWFPFIALDPNTISKMVSLAEGGNSIDDHLPDIHREVLARIPIMKSTWKESPQFKTHYEFLDRAIERYLEGDHISSSSILFTKIEGILRSYLEKEKPSSVASQENLAKTVTLVGKTERHSYSLLMPEKFQRYLEEVYFADFNLQNPDSTQVINRNTVSHGVASTEAFSLKASTIGLLIVDQLSYYPTSDRLVVQD